MKRLLVSRDTVFLEYLRRRLTDLGIGAFVRNATNSGSAAGELSPLISPPELWVASEDFASAERLLREVEEAFASAGKAPWRCPRCGESLDAAFDLCWRCGTPRPD